MTVIDDTIEAEAAGWAVKAQDGALSETDIVALSDWMDVSPRHAEAFRDALSLWLSLDEPEREALRPPAPRRALPRTAFFRRPATLAWSACLATAAAIAVAAICVSGTFAPKTFYETGKGERRDVALGNGIHLMLNTDTRLSVRERGGRPILDLQHGEVAIAIDHHDSMDDSHPLRVHAGDLRLTDVGTIFDVRRDGGQVGVSVRQGQVDMSEAAESGPVAHLRAGDFGVYEEKDGRSAVSKRDPADVFAWQTSHAIYRDQPLSVVAADLNRYYNKPIIVEGNAAQLRLTAILTLDSQTAVAGRLTEFLPLNVRTTPDAIYLSRRTAGG